MTITELKNKVDIARKGIEPETSSIIKSNEVKILDYVRVDQLYKKGEDGNGAQMGVYKRDYTSESIGGWGDNSRITAAGLPKKIRQPYNFLWSGFTASNFKLDYANFELLIFNQGSSAKTLLSAYSQDLFSMSDENQLKMSKEIIRPNLLKYLQNIFK